METEPISIKVTFTPATKAAFPALNGWLTALPPQLLGRLIGMLQVNDLVQLQGIPTTAPMRVFMRIWTLMADQAELEVVLHARDIPTGNSVGDE